MKCKPVASLPASDEWVYEIKFDGFRGLAVKDGDKVRLISRTRKDLGARFPKIVSALRELPVEQITLDGEVVSLDKQGRSSFQRLQNLDDLNHESANLFFYAFDLLNLNGYDTTGLPLVERKALLRSAIQGTSDRIRLSDILPGEIDEIRDAMQKMGLEGLIAKKRNSIYESSARSGSWVKVKWTHEQEFVIGGYTSPEGSRPYFGAVLLGFYEGSKLIFAGKAGSGFNAKSLKSLYDQFQEIRIEKTPFVNLPERDGVIGPAQMRFCKWVQPIMVCQVRFTEWTGDGHLRQPVFLGMRDDKDPREVVKEGPA